MEPRVLGIDWIVKSLHGWLSHVIHHHITQCCVFCWLGGNPLNHHNRCQFKKQEHLTPGSSPGPCVGPHGPPHSIFTLHGPRNGGHPRSPVQRVAWSWGVDSNVRSRLPSAASREAWTMYLKWSPLSRWRFKRVPHQRLPGRDRMAAGFRPGQSLTRTKKQTCSRPLLPPPCPPPAKTTPVKVCASV